MKNRLRMLRNENNLTLAELSADLKKTVHLDLTPDTLSKYERGDREPKMEVWHDLSFYFDVPVPYLMGLDDTKYSVNTASWLDQYIDEVKQYHPSSPLNSSNINIGEIKTIVLDFVKFKKINIIGDEKETKNLVHQAIAISLAKMDYTNSGTIEYFKYYVTRAARMVQERYGNEPNQKISIDLLGDMWNLMNNDFFKKLDDLKKKYPDD